MARKTSAVLTNLCMVRDGDRVLVQNRRSRDWPGATFPGGHVEPGESMTEAVIREVREETGLTIRHPRLCGVKDWNQDDGSRYVVLLYQATAFSGELRSSDEGEVFWTPLVDLPKLKLAGGMEELLRVFLEDDLSEFYYDRRGGDWRIVLQ